MSSSNKTQNRPLSHNGRDGVITEPNGLLYMRARYYSPTLYRFINADIISGEISDSTSLNRYAYVNGNPVSKIDPFGLLGFWGKLAIGVGAVVIGAVIVAATAATGGAAAAFVAAATAGIKTAAISGAIAGVVGAANNAINHRLDTGTWKGAGEIAVKSAVEGFADGVMWGGITTGGGMTIGALGKQLKGIQIGHTAKPQYGRVNALYGTPNTNGTTVISVQNSAGKRLFSLDFDAIHAVHMHIPKLTSHHIPIGGIISGTVSRFKSVVKQEGDYRK